MFECICEELQFLISHPDGTALLVPTRYRALNLSQNLVSAGGCASEIRMITEIRALMLMSGPVSSDIEIFDSRPHSRTG